MKRRAFVGSALTGMSVTGAYEAPPKVKAGDIPTTRFGKTGIEVSVIARGGARMDLHPDIPSAAAHVRRMYDIGVSYFDCARLYWGGRSEEAYGIGLQGVRKNVFLTTKTVKRTAKEVEEDLQAVKLRWPCKEESHVGSQRFSRLCRSAIVFGATVAGAGAASGAMAQALKDLQTPEAPLVLKAQGSFFVGGEKASQTQVELGGLGPGGNITVNQMYVRYMVPQGGDGNVPVVMVHGATLTGKSWETTPDGRMGWDEYFVRKGHPVYVPDQVGRGRSGFNQALFNNVRAGAAPAAKLPPWLRFSDEVVWPNFRFGAKPGEPFADARFPVAAVDELSKQGVPDISFGGLPAPNPTFKALSDLASQLGGAVLMGHSQSGRFPLEAALLDPTAAKALVLVEPGVFPNRYTDEQVKTLAKVPILVVFGDHRDTATGIGSRPSWRLSFDGCQELIGRLKSASGQAQMLDPAQLGIKGNSHMIMQDKNHLQIADLILQWIGEHVAKRSGAKQ